MAIDPTRLAQRLMERNPGMDAETLADAVFRAMQDDKKLVIAIASDVAETMGPIWLKNVKGLPLTDEEQAMLDLSRSTDRKERA
jgi:hypothetical protein